MCSTDDVESNWSNFTRLSKEAIDAGATVICTPENTFFLGAQFHKVALAEPIDGSTGQRCAAFAKEHGIYLFIGSMAEQHRLDNGEIDTERCFNTSVVYAPTGERIATYRKIHLFDVDIPGGMSIAESDRVIPGTEPVVVETVDGNFGLSICYDLRFPELYRKLQEAGAKILLIPSAFTEHTGQAHWHALLRARAIEFQSWVIAPAQTGTHDREGTRQSFGHALIIDPWGRIVGDAGKEPGFILADVDTGLVESIRMSMPVSSHRRL
jgi:predicted amidohydrolase